MAKYITEFATLAAYQASKYNLDYPNVSLINADGSVVYDKTSPQHDYSKDYFTIVSEADNNTVSIQPFAYPVAITVSASTDNGLTWTAYTANTITVATIDRGQKILLKGVNNAWASIDNSGAHVIQASAAFHVEGNVMSLLYGDNFVGQTSLDGRDYAFGYLFNGATTLTSAENLILPATTLDDLCYMNMFYGCTSLTTAPELPATTLKNCCYQQMFYNCTNLNYIKCLATDITAANCTNAWTNGVSATGTFVKNPNMSSWTTGASGIPSDWTVEDN